MPLQGDQRALLQLLCERGQSYEDIAGLLGSSPDGVRAQARAALSELGGGDPDADVGLTDYLLGQADPIGRADAVRFLQSDPGSLELATKIEEGLREIAPAANLPRLPEPRGKRRRAAAPASGEPTDAPPRTGDPDRIEAVSSGGGARTANRQTRLIAAIAGAGVILVFVILAVAGVFSSDDGAQPASTSASSGDETTAAADQGRKLTEVKLAANGDSGVAGNAAFGIVSGNQPYVDLAVEGLDPKASENSAYFLWLMIGDTGGYPIPQPLTPDKNGRFSGRIAISTTVASTIATQADSVRVSLSPINELGVAAKHAAKQGVPVVPFTGTELAGGKIPVVAPTNG